MKWKTKQDFRVRLAPGALYAVISGKTLEGVPDAAGDLFVEVEGSTSEDMVFGAFKEKNYNWRLVLLASGMVSAQAIKTAGDIKKAADQLLEENIKWDGTTLAEVMGGADGVTYLDTIEAALGTAYFTPTSQ